MPVRSQACCHVGKRVLDGEYLLLDLQKHLFDLVLEELLLLIQLVQTLAKVHIASLSRLFVPCGRACTSAGRVESRSGWPHRFLDHS